MTSVRLLPNPIWPWPWVVLTGVLMVTLVLPTYRPRLRDLPGRTPPAAAARSGSWRRAVLLFAMLRPTLQFTEKDDDPAQMIVLGDKSRSMNTPDGAAGATRRQTLLKLLKDNEEQPAELGKNVEFRYFDFDTGIRRGRDVRWRRR